MTPSVKFFEKYMKGYEDQVDRVTKLVYKIEDKNFLHDCRHFAAEVITRRHRKHHNDLVNSFRLRWKEATCKHLRVSRSLLRSMRRL